jgi:hydrogenase/urease accessory protein HupE
MAADSASLPYQEPDIVTILIQAGFLLALNLVNSALDKLVYCGLVGQLFIGIAWGVPGANWLSQNVQQVIQQLSYLGLILLVYEGQDRTRIAPMFFRSCFSFFSFFSFLPFSK